MQQTMVSEDTRGDGREGAHRLQTRHGHGLALELGDLGEPLLRRLELSAQIVLLADFPARSVLGAERQLRAQRLSAVQQLREPAKFGLSTKRRSCLD
jgi:hypothetical protein